MHPDPSPSPGRGGRHVIRSSAGMSVSQLDRRAGRARTRGPASATATVQPEGSCADRWLGRMGPRCRSSLHTWSPRQRGTASCFVTIGGRRRLGQAQVGDHHPQSRVPREVAMPEVASQAPVLLLNLVAVAEITEVLHQTPRRRGCWRRAHEAPECSCPHRRRDPARVAPAGPAPAGAPWPRHLH